MVKYSRKGMWRHPLYSTYREMRRQCEVKGSRNYKYRGARGIRVCDRWVNGDGEKIGFECFIEDMGKRPKDRYFNRKDASKDFTPENCCWTTMVGVKMTTYADRVAAVKLREVQSKQAAPDLSPREKKMAKNGVALVFDTETTGIVDFRKPADDPDQPRLLSLGAALVDHTGAELDRNVVYVKPEGFEVDEYGDAFAVNGLTNDFLNEKGVPVAQVLEEYAAMVDLCDFITAFNIRFDQKIIRGECRRIGRDDRYGYRPTFEMMYTSRSLACAVGGPYSNPKKLGEVYANILGRELQNAHDVRADLEAKIEILCKLIDHGMVEPKEQISKDNWP